MLFSERKTVSTVLMLLCCLLALLVVVRPSVMSAAEVKPRHVVVLGDPHLPGSRLEQKQQAIRTINGWADVDLVVAVGDLCQAFGNSLEYAAAKSFFASLQKPFAPIVGNHDFYYADKSFAVGSKTSKTAKLLKFKETFGLDEIYYSKPLGDYQLIFLSIDAPEFMTEISPQQLAWLRLELAKTRPRPTIIFFHAPLEGTFSQVKSKYLSYFDTFAQPSETLHEILKANPQVMLWVSGHAHISPDEESFSSPMNLYDKRVMNIHNTDMLFTPEKKRDAIWTNSLFLYPDKVVVKTFDHQVGVWLPRFERTVPVPSQIEPK